MFLPTTNCQSFDWPDEDSMRNSSQQPFPYPPSAEYTEQFPNQNNPYPPSQPAYPYQPDQSSQIYQAGYAASHHNYPQPPQQDLSWPQQYPNAPSFQAQAPNAIPYPVSGAAGFPYPPLSTSNEYNPPAIPDYTMGNSRQQAFMSWRNRSSIDDHIKQFNNQDYATIKQDCLRAGILFEDPTFKISNSLLVTPDSSGLFPRPRKSTRDKTKSIEWLRPHEICQRLGIRKPRMFVSKFDRFDVNQGEIGNCWLLAALSSLAENEKLFKKVVPDDQNFRHGYSGIFRFRFWRFGEWVEVVIDDRLPTRNGELIYLRSVERREFWSALLEKAYAKLYGSYKALEGGLTIEAAVDFTGGIPEMIDLRRTKLDPEKIFLMIVKAAGRGAFLGCAINPLMSREAKTMGLQSRHAYTITKVIELRGLNTQGIPLLRIRNPHGNHREWTGAWSDRDKNWERIPGYAKEKLELSVKHDGEFYMDFRDFMKYFSELEICHINPGDFGEDFSKQFETFSFFGKWEKGISSGGCGNDGFACYSMNPQFFINLSDPNPYDKEDTCSVVISLSQQMLERKTEVAIGFKLYKCPTGTKYKRPHSCCQLDRNPPDMLNRESLMKEVLHGKFLDVKIDYIL